MKNYKNNIEIVITENYKSEKSKIDQFMRSGGRLVIIKEKVDI